MILHPFYLSGLAVNTYMIGDEATRQVAIIDPTLDIEPYLRYALEHRYQITHIVETHVHADFVSGSLALKNRLNGTPIIHCSSEGGPQWTPSYADTKVKTGDIIHLGSVRLQAMHTPGHTPEHLIWIAYDENRSKDIPCLAFTGDLLFVGSVGRPDLLGKNEILALSHQLYHSLFSDLAALPDYVEIYPAHGAGSLCGKALSSRPTSTLGYERLFNPSLKKLPVEQWIHNLLHDMPAAPANFARLKKINVQGADMPTLTQNLLYLDARHPEVFAQGHIRGSINIPLTATFCNWVGTIIPGEAPLAVVAGDIAQLEEAIHNLKLVGYTSIAKKLVWDPATINRDFPIETLSLCPVTTLAQKTPSPYILDIRTPAEWNAGHIPEAHHLELTSLPNHFAQIPSDTPVYAICGSGMRSSIAASFLKSKGYHNVQSVQGGMNAWKKAQLPVTVV